MYLSSITANVLNKFNDQKINILYEPQYNLFDILLAECGLNLFVSQNDRFVNLLSSNITTLNENQSDLFNYNVGITNNIIGYSNQKKYDVLHLNTIIFTHSYKPTAVKKEDIVLLNNSVKNAHKVFFDSGSRDSWKLDNSILINYGIPLDKFYPTNDDRSSRVLMLNLDRNPNISTLVEFLEKHNIDVDIVQEISGDLELLTELFNKYKVCIDLSDYNISNLLVCIACGCQAITYATPMIIENYSNTPNLYTATNVQDLISSIKKAMLAETIDHTEYYEQHYNFTNFATNISNIVTDSNNKAFIL